KRLNIPVGNTILRFKHEFREVQDIHHQNLIKLYELLQYDGHWFYTMELVDGVDFLDYVRPFAGAEHEAVPAAPHPSMLRDTDLDTKPLIGGPDADELSHNPNPHKRGIVQAGGLKLIAQKNRLALQPRSSARRPGRLDLIRLRPALAQLAAGVHALHC